MRVDFAKQPMRFAHWVGRYFLLALLLHGHADAQGNGRLSGIVEDAAGRAVSGARVTLSPHDWTSVSSVTVASRAGAFFFPALRPSLYDLTVEAPSFAKQTMTSVRIDPAAETALPPIHLASGAASSAGPAIEAPNQPLQPASVEIANPVDDTLARNLPLPSRDPFYLLETLPGIQTNGRAPLSFDGESFSLGNILYDGVNLEQSAARGSALNASTLLLRTGEVNEVTAVIGAMDGCGCAQAAFSAPGGSNLLHGSAYGLAVPNGVTAQYWKANSQKTPASTNLDQIGGTLSGPLRKNHLFFFLNEEVDLNRSTVTRTGQAPFSPLTSQDSLLSRVLALIPSSPSGVYRGTQNNGNTGNIAMARLDYLISPRQSLGLTFASNNSSTDDPADSSVFGRKPTTTIGVSSLLYSASWRWSLTPHLTNELHAGASLEDLDDRNSLRSKFGFIAILQDPGVPVSQPMAGIDPQSRKDHLHSYQDNLALVWGKHRVQAGVWFQHYALESDGFNYGTLDSVSVPRYIVGNIAEGAIDETDQRFNITSATSGYSSGSIPRSNLSTYMIAPNLHETWKPIRSLSISLGARWGFVRPPNETTGTAIIPNLSGDVSAAVYNKQMTFAPQSPANPFYGRDTDGVSGEAGLAWKPFEKLPVILRGSISGSYIEEDLLPNFSLYALENPFQSFNVSTGFTSPISLSKAPAMPVPVMPSLTLPGLLAFANSYGQQPGPVYGVNPNLATPNVKYWNFGIEAQKKGFLFALRYAGNRLEEGPRSVDRNQVMTSPAFLSAVQQVQAALLSDAPTQGIPGLPGGGICSNFSLQNCQPDLVSRSLIETGQSAELGRWLEGQRYNLNGAYNFLGNPLSPQGVYVLSHLGVSRYDALQVTMSRRFSKGLGLNASYVLSKVMSNLDDYRSGAIDPYLDLHNSSFEWAPSPFNLTNVFKASFTWDLPFFKGAVSARTSPGKLLRGWSLSGIVMAQSGAPFSLLSGGYVSTPAGSQVPITGLGTFTSQADSGENTVQTSLTAGQIRSYFGLRENPSGALSYVNAPAGAFQEPGIDSMGNLARRMFTGPGAFNLNLGLRKTVIFSERISAEFRAESINVLNNVNWLVGDQAYMGANAQNNTSLFSGNITQWNSPRTFQFFVRILF